jgi:heptosyltransferase II
MNKQNFNYKKLNNISFVVELPFGLGDQIMCFPLFASIKKAMPQSEITVLSPNKNSTFVLSKNKYINNIYEYGLTKFTYFNVLKFFIKDFIKLWFYFKKNSFDFFIIIHPNPFRTLLSKLLSYKKLIINNEHTHKTKEVINILNQLKIVPVYNYEMTIQDIGGIESKFKLKNNKFILINIYAQYIEKDLRQWPYFDELIKQLKRRDENIVIVGLHPRHNRRTDIIDLVNVTSLEELFAIIKNAKLIVTIDGGIFHFAYSLNVPVVGIFGPLNPINFIPFNNQLRVQTIYKNKDCSPCIVNKVQIECGNTENKYCCMKDISVDEVMGKIEEL